MASVLAFAAKLEETQPAAFAELYKDYSMKRVDVKDEGKGMYCVNPFVPELGKLCPLVLLRQWLAAHTHLCQDNAAPFFV